MGGGQAEVSHTLFMKAAFLIQVPLGGSPLEYEAPV